MSPGKSRGGAGKGKSGTHLNPSTKKHEKKYADMEDDEVRERLEHKTDGEYFFSTFNRNKKRK